MSPSGSAALLGLGTALCFGVGDFTAQRLTARAGWLRALLAVQVVSLPLIVGLALWRSGVPALAGGTAGLLLGIGLLNIFGLVALYRAFAVGVLSLVAPIASSFAAVTVALAAVDGRAPAGATAIGLFAVIAGVVTVSAAHGAPAATGRPLAGRRGAGVAWAVFSSLSMGTVFFGLERANAELGPLWPVAALRVIGVGVLLALAGARSGPPGALSWPLVLVCAVLDTGGMVLYTTGTGLGNVAVVAVLASLFSVVTIVLAQLRLHERLGRGQWLGIALVVAGTAWVTYRTHAGG